MTVFLTVRTWVQTLKSGQVYLSLGLCLLPLPRPLPQGPGDHLCLCLPSSPSRDIVFLQVLQGTLLTTHNVPGTVLDVDGAGLSVPTRRPHVMKTKKGIQPSSGDWGKLPGGSNIETGM